MGQMPFLSSSGALKYYFQRKINYKYAFLLLFSSIPAAQITAYFIGHIEDTAFGQNIFYKHLTYADAFIAVFYSLLLFSLGTYGILKSKNENKLNLIKQNRLYYTIFGMGICFGVISALFGIGGGFLTVPFFIYYLKLKPSEAAATSLFCIFILSFLITLYYIYINHIYFSISLIAALGTIPGAFLGAKINLKTPPEKMKKYFGLLQIIVALSYLLLKLK